MKKKQSVRENLTKLALGKTFEAPGGALIIGPFKEKKNSDFVTSRTNDIFPALWFNDTFVQNPLRLGRVNHTKVHVMAVVNNSVERGFTFIEKFNTAPTTKEEYTQ